MFILEARIVEKTHTLTRYEDKDAPVASTTTSAADTTTVITGNLAAKMPALNWETACFKADILSTAPFQL